MYTMYATPSNYTPSYIPWGWTLHWRPKWREWLAMK